MELPEIQKALLEIKEAIEALPPEGRRALLIWLRDLDAATHATPRPVRQTKPKSPATLRQAVLWSLFSIVAFFIVDAAIFRSGWYYNYLEPDSTAGQMELQLFWLRHTPPAKVPEAAVIGDSRVAEGFGARKAGEVTGEKIHFWNLGVGGSSPRTWYYLLRDGDPSRSRFHAIAIAIDHYSDEDGGDVPAERLGDLNYAIGRLRVTDCLDLAQSFHSWEKRRAVLTGCIFKAVPLRRDVQGLLSNPKLRFALARDWRNNGHGYIDGYGGKPEAMTGLTADFEKRTLDFPAGLKDWQQSSARATVMPSGAPQTGSLTAYRKLWLGRILDLYKGSRTQIVFFELPRAPLPTPDKKTPPRFIQSVMGHPRVTVLPVETFRDLEHPEVFADGLHLNHVGRPLLSERLGQIIAGITGEK